MMANFGYVLTKGSMAQLQNGSTVEARVVENEQSLVLASLNKGGQTKSINATFVLTAKSARERRRTAEVLMREGEGKRLCGTCKVALPVWPPCAWHSRPLPHLHLGEKRPSKRFAHANKISAIARTMLQRGLLLKRTRNGRSF